MTPQIAPVVFWGGVIALVLLGGIAAGLREIDRKLGRIADELAYMNKGERTREFNERHPL